MEEIIKKEFPKDPIMVNVARCESGFRQFNPDGTVLISRTADWGIFQINQVNHRTMSKLGIDISTLEGNIEGTQYILKTQGLNAWKNSSHCWLPHIKDPHWSYET